MPASPPISDDEGDHPSGFPGASGLKHSQTIMGPNRSGGLGLRVSAKRASLSKRHSRRLDAPRVHIEGASPQDTPKHAEGPPESWVKVSEIDSSVLEMGKKAVDEPPPPDPPSKGVQFIPKFKGAAEMEARRRVRMQARRGPLAVDAKPPLRVVANINPELSSSDEDEVGLGISDEDDDDDFEEIGGDDGMDDGDEFDP